MTFLIALINEITLITFQEALLKRQENKAFNYVRNGQPDQQDAGKSPIGPDEDDKGTKEQEQEQGQGQSREQGELKKTTSTSTAEQGESASGAAGGERAPVGSDDPRASGHIKHQHGTDNSRSSNSSLGAG